LRKKIGRLARPLRERLEYGDLVHSRELARVADDLERARSALGELHGLREVRVLLHRGLTLACMPCMTKLYYARGACSLAPHIALCESGLPFELDRVDLRAKRTSSGKDYLTINSKGYVPALETDGGEILTEAPVVLQWIADQAPEAHLAPPYGTIARYRVQE